MKMPDRKNPDTLRKRVLTRLGRNGFFHRMDDKRYISMIYASVFGRKPDLEHPSTFNEVIQWLKLYDRDPLYTKLVDKYEVKSLVADVIGGEYIVPTYGVWDSFDEIDFDALPDRFVLKCTHDSGGVVLCPDKSELDRKAARKKISAHLKRNFYLYGREWPYKAVKPRVIAEMYLRGDGGKDLRDYKFFCFHGEAKFFKVDFDRESGHRANYYDRDGNLQRFGELVCPPAYDRELCLPSSIGRMAELAEKLSASRIFERVDFYDVDGKIYFGEITFHPNAGFGKFIPEEWDEKLGEFFHLPLPDGRNSRE